MKTVGKRGLHDTRLPYSMDAPAASRRIGAPSDRRPAALVGQPVFGARRVLAAESAALQMPLSRAN